MTVAFPRKQPPRRGERPTPPPAARRNVREAHLRCRWRRPRNKLNQTRPLLRRLSFSLLTTNRAHRARESPSPHTARGAARHSNRAVSTLTKARAVTRTRPPQRRAHRASYWPFGRKNSLRPRADGNRPNNSSLFGRFPTPALARGASYPDELELASGRPGPACSR